jgi:hypothetical protein
MTNDEMNSNSFGDWWLPAGEYGGSSNPPVDVRRPSFSCYLLFSSLFFSSLLFSLLFSPFLSVLFPVDLFFVFSFVLSFFFVSHSLFSFLLLSVSLFWAFIFLLYVALYYITAPFRLFFFPPLDVQISFPPHTGCLAACLLRPTVRSRTVFTRRFRRSAEQQICQDRLRTHACFNF